MKEFYDRMRQVQLERRAAAKVEARRKEIESRKMKTGAEVERMAATAARVAGFDKVATVKKRSAAADAALNRIIQFLEENKLMMADVFNMMDVDNSGELDAGELYSTMTRFGMYLTEVEADEVCDSMDVDGDGTVERGEFFKRYKELSRERRRAGFQDGRAAGTQTFQTIGTADYKAGPTARPARPGSGSRSRWRPSTFVVAAASTTGGATNGGGGDQPPLAVVHKPESAAARLQAQRLPCRPLSAARKVAEPVRPASAAARTEAVVGASLKGATDTHGMKYEDVLLARVYDNKLRLSELFDQIDRDNSGSIDIKELRTLLMLIGVDVADPAKLQPLFDKLDGDGDGEVTLAEFLSAIQQIQRSKATVSAGKRRQLPLAQQHPIMFRQGAGKSSWNAAAVFMKSKSVQSLGLDHSFAGNHAAIKAAPKKIILRPASAAARLQSQNKNSASSLSAGLSPSASQPASRRESTYRSPQSRTAESGVWTTASRSSQSGRPPLRPRMTGPKVKMANSAAAARKVRAHFDLCCSATPWCSPPAEHC